MGPYTDLIFRNRVHIRTLTGPYTDPIFFDKVHIRTLFSGLIVENLGLPQSFQQSSPPPEVYEDHTAFPAEDLGLPVPPLSSHEYNIPFASPSRMPCSLSGRLSYISRRVLLSLSSWTPNREPRCSSSPVKRNLTVQPKYLQIGTTSSASKIPLSILDIDSASSSEIPRTRRRSDVPARCDPRRKINLEGIEDSERRSSERRSSLFDKPARTASSCVLIPHEASEPVKRYSTEHPSTSQIGTIQEAGGSVFLFFQFDTVLFRRPRSLQRE